MVMVVMVMVVMVMVMVMTMTMTMMMMMIMAGNSAVQSSHFLSSCVTGGINSLHTVCLMLFSNLLRLLGI